MARTSIGRRIGTMGAVAAATALLAVAGGQAAVAAPTCGTTEPAATMIAPGVCEVVVMQSGAFTAPAGISKLSALVVGAGGGALSYDGRAWGAGSGEVVYVDSVPLDSAASVLIGAAGTASFQSPQLPPFPGGPTILNGVQADGGFLQRSGNGFESPSAELVNSGPGATAPGLTSSGSQIYLTGGAGVLPSEVVGVDPTLFPVIDGERPLAVGGDASDLIGGARPAGIGGGGSVSASEALAGGEGAVIFRYAAFDDGVVPVTETEPEPGTETAAATPAAAKPALAETGFESTGLIAGASGAAILGAGALLLGRRRAARTPR